jgi:hypothetical protein
MFGEIEHAEYDGLGRQLAKHRAVEVRLRGLDRVLVDRRACELRQERIARRPHMDDRRVAEANVDCGRAGDAVERHLFLLRASVVYEVSKREANDESATRQIFT